MILYCDFFSLHDKQAMHIGMMTEAENWEMYHLSQCLNSRENIQSRSRMQAPPPLRPHDTSLFTSSGPFISSPIPWEKFQARQQCSNYDLVQSSTRKVQAEP